MASCEEDIDGRYDCCYVEVEETTMSSDRKLFIELGSL